MATGPRLLETVPMGKGCEMEIWVDESQAEDSVDRRWTLTIYDGKDGSTVPDVPAHWHKYHDEHMTVVEGEADFFVDGKKTRLKQGDQTVLPRCTVHAIKGIPGIKLAVKEATDPTGDFKEEFFLDLLKGGWPGGFWHVHRTFFDNDVYVALGVPWFLGGQYVDQAYINVVGGIAKFVSTSKKPLEEMRKDAREGRY